MTGPQYRLGNIRNLLTQAFSEEELRRLCFDVPDFRAVYDSIPNNAGKTEIVTKLIEHAERNLLIDTILALARELNPARYEKHQPYYVTDPTHNLQKQIATLARRLSEAETNPETIVAIALARSEARRITATTEHQILQEYNRIQGVYIAYILEMIASLKEAGVAEDLIGTILQQLITSGANKS